MKEDDGKSLLPMNEGGPGEAVMPTLPARYLNSQLLPPCHHTRKFGSQCDFTPYELQNIEYREITVAKIFRPQRAVLHSLE